MGLLRGRSIKINIYFRPVNYIRTKFKCLSYLFVTPEGVDAGLPPPEVRLIDDVIVDQRCRMDHFCYHGHLPLGPQNGTGKKIKNKILKNFINGF